MQVELMLVACKNFLKIKTSDVKLKIPAIRAILITYL